jgi:ligand-binding sensor domain-containing protein
MCAAPDIRHRPRRRCVRRVAAGVLLAVAPAAAAQRPDAARDEATPYVQEGWTVEDGLPVNAINALLQSRDGYLWLATFDGLVRFDGVRFTVFNAANTPGLPSNRIVGLLEARDGTLWLRTEQGHLVRFRDGRFTAYGAAQGLDELTSTTTYEDAAGTFWVGTPRGVRRLAGDRLVPADGGVIAADVSSLYRDRTGALWAGTAERGVYRIRGGRSRASASPRASPPAG